jgi:hypothetical protein
VEYEHKQVADTERDTLDVLEAVLRCDDWASPYRCRMTEVSGFPTPGATPCDNDLERDPLSKDAHGLQCKLMGLSGEWDQNRLDRIF